MVKSKISDDLADAVIPIDPPSRAKHASKPTAKPKSMTQPQLRKAIASSFELLGFGIGTLDAFDGEVIVDNADDMADALIELGKTNPSVMRWLENLVGVSAWGGVLTVLGVKVAAPIAIHHGVLPAEMAAFMEGEIPIKGELKVVPDPPQKDTVDPNANA
jgi:hypothetical protein